MPARWWDCNQDVGCTTITKGNRFMKPMSLSETFRGISFVGPKHQITKRRQCKIGIQKNKTLLTRVRASTETPLSKNSFTRGVCPFSQAMCISEKSTYKKDMNRSCQRVFLYYVYLKCELCARFFWQCFHLHVYAFIDYVSMQQVTNKIFKNPSLDSILGHHGRDWDKFLGCRPNALLLW